MFKNASTCVVVTTAAAAAVLLWTLSTSGRAIQNQVPPLAGQTDNVAVKELYSQRCGQCHNLPKPEEKMMTRREWQSTVNRMLYKDKAIDVITIPESITIVNYLSGFAPKGGGFRAGLTPWSTDSVDVWTSVPTATRVYNVVDQSALANFQSIGSGDHGPAAHWSIAPDASGPAFKVTPKTASPSRFSMLIDKNGDSRNVDVKLSFQIVTGHASPATGIVFGYKSPDNYYVLRYSQSDSSLSVLKMDGPVHTALQKVDLASPVMPATAAPKTAADSNAVPEPLTIGPGWHTLRLLVNDGRIRAWIDRNKRIYTEDGAYSGGRVGLWSQGNTVAEFKDITVDSYSPSDTQTGAAAKTMN